MKVQYSGIGITEATGKLDNSVHTRNRGGNVVRAYVIPTNTITARRTFIRNAITTLSQTWPLLPQSNRDAWNQAVLQFRVTGKLGIEYYHSGFNYYIKQTFNILLAGGMSSGLPIAPRPFTGPQLFSASMPNSTTLLVTCSIFKTDNVVPADTIYLVAASIGVSQGINYKRTGIVLISGFTAGTDTTNQDISIDWSSVFGAFVSGTKIFLKAYGLHVISGQSSKPVFATVIVP